MLQGWVMDFLILSLSRSAGSEGGVLEAFRSDFGEREIGNTGTQSIVFVYGCGRYSRLEEVVL